MSETNKNLIPWNIWQEHLGVTRSHDAVGRPGRIISARLLPGTDLVIGIQDLMTKHGVTCGWANAFGSLAGAHFSPGISMSKDQPDMMERSPDLNLEEPLEIWSGQGKLGLDEQGNSFMHFHGLVSDLKGRIYGGHFFPGGNPIYITCEVMIQEILDVEHPLIMNEVAKVPLMEVRQK
jgi:predicted DNA-binding protein with PD1-like motif